jgi:drug/metabolite transporter (DMT)-like permease
MPHLKDHLKLVGMAALWGASWPCGRVLAQGLPPLTAACLRFLLASAMLVAWLSRRHGLAALGRLSGRQWAGLTVAGAVGVFGYAVCFMMGLQRVPASRAALVVTTNPALTMLIAAWMFKERLSITIGVGMLLAAAGAAVVITHGAPWRLLTGGLGLGELLLLGCVLSWTAYTLLGRCLLSGLDSLTTTTTTALTGCALLLAVALPVEGPSGFAALTQAPPAIWTALLFLAAGATVVAYAWYFDGVQALGAGAAAAYITLVPLFGVLFSALLLGEPIDRSIAFGGALAIGGMAAMNIGRARMRPR